MKHKILFISAVLLLCAVIGVAVGAATNLGIQEQNTLTGLQAESCMTSSAVSTQYVEQSKTMRITGFDAGCYGSTATITLLYSNNTPQVTLSSPVNQNGEWSHSQTISAPSAINGVFVHIDGWQIPASWTPPAASPSYQVTYTWNQPSPRQFCVDVRVSTTSSAPVDWNVTFNADQYPLNGETIIANYHITSGYVISPLTSRTFQVKGSGSNATVIVGANRTFQVCNYNTPLPPLPGADSGITITSIPGALPARGYYVCQSVQVRSTGSEFYVGWSLRYDSKPLASRYIPGGGRLVPPSQEYTVLPRGNGVYDISSTGWNDSSVRPANPVNLQICWGSLA